MNPLLGDLIQRFRAAQDRGVAAIVEILGPTLGVRSPRSNREWVEICLECGLYNVRWINGIEIYAHGYGIELLLGDVTIDFDWGDAGEPDGFDVWRLWNFAQLNPSAKPCPEQDQIRKWIEEGVANGELIQDSCLYYSPAHRGQTRFQPNVIIDRILPGAQSTGI